jgi:uncharacterized protein
MPIPSKSECFAMLGQMKTPEHIVAHSLQVCQVAEVLADALAGCGTGLNRDLVTAAALLHDITKNRSFTTGENHAATGASFLAEKGFERVGWIVGQHVILENDGARVQISEAAIVNYADKRILHDKLVSLDDRMAYIVECYGTRPAYARRLQRLWKETTVLEKKIWEPLPVTPADLDGLLDPSALDDGMAAYREICAEHRPET